MAKINLTAIAKRGIPELGTSAPQLYEFCKKHDGLTLEIEVKTPSKKKSNPMNKYFWGVFVPHVQKCLEQQGDQRTQEEVVWDLKDRFFHYYKEINGVRRKYPRSLKNSEWESAEFQQELEKCRNWFISFFSYTIPNPNEQDYN